MVYSNEKSKGRNTCHLNDNSIHLYNFCSCSPNAYRDIKNLNYIGEGYIHEVDGHLQTSVNTERYHFWYKPD